MRGHVRRGGDSVSLMRGEFKEFRGSCAMRGGARQKQGRSKSESRADGKRNSSTASN